MKASELNAIHRSLSSWVLGIIYFAPGDPRLLVRKRIAALGWTINFARPMALPFLLGSLGAFFGGLWSLASTDLSADLKWAGFLGLFALMVGLWAWVANPRRFLD